MEHQSSQRNNNRLHSNHLYYSFANFFPSLLLSFSPSLLQEKLAGLGYNTRFSIAAASCGQQTMIFSLLSAVTLHRALSHPDWLVSTLCFVAYAFVGCFCYFSFAPSVPFPTALSANVFTLMLFVKRDMYDGVHLDLDDDGDSFDSFDSSSFLSFSNSSIPSPHRRPPSEDTGAPSVCDAAYSYNLLFMTVNYLSIAMVGALFLIGCLAESRRRKVGLIADQTSATPLGNRAGNRTLGNAFAGASVANRAPIRGTDRPMFLTLREFTGFFLMLWGKNLTAYTALKVS